MSEAQTTSEISGRSASTEKSASLKQKLERWRDERRDRGQKNARDKILKAVEKDEKREKEGKTLTSEQTSSLTRGTVQRAEKFLGEKDEVSTKPRKDMQTGELVTARIRKESGGWVAEEMVIENTPDGRVNYRVISQARITAGGTELTLNYGERYEQIGANPGIIIARNYPGATAETFNLLAKHIMSEATSEGRHFAAGERGARERLLGKEEFDRRRLEVRQKIESGEDQEGSLIFHGLEEAFRLSVDDTISGEARFGTYFMTYGGARASAEKIDDPAELNRAILSLRMFHQQLGLEEYKVNIETREGMSEEERRNLIREKVMQDVDAMPTLMARHLMSDYVNHKANTVGLEERLNSKFPTQIYERGSELADFPPRDLTRLDALGLQREGDRLYWAEERLLGLTGSTDLKREVYSLRRARLSFTREDLTPLSSRIDQERQNLINERTTLLRQQLLDSKGEKTVQAFENLSDDEKRVMVEKLLESEFAAEVSYRNLGSSLSIEDADRIGNMLNEAKQSRMKVKDTLAEIQVSLAEQRGTNAIHKLREVRRKIALGPKREPLLEEVKEGFSAVKEVVDAKVSEYFAPAKKVITEALDKTLAVGEATSDEFTKWVVEPVEKVLDATVVRAADVVGDKLKSTADELQAEYRRLSHTSRERTKYWWRKQYYDKRHAIRVGLDKALTAAEVQVEVRRRAAGVIGRGILGGGLLSEEEKAKFKEKRRILRKTASKVLRSAELFQVSKENRTYAEKRKDAPEFQRFWQEVEMYVTENTKPIETSPTVEPEVIPRPAEPMTAEKFMADHPGLKDYEVVRYKFPGEENDRHVNFWWDGKSMKYERIRPDGSVLMELGSENARTPKEAEDCVDKIVKQFLAEEGVEYTRHLRFSVGEEAKLNLGPVDEGEFFVEEAVEAKNKLPDAPEGDYVFVSSQIPGRKERYFLYFVKNNTVYQQETDENRVPLEGSKPLELKGKYFTEERARRRIEEKLDGLRKKGRNIVETPLELTEELKVEAIPGEEKEETTAMVTKEALQNNLAEAQKRVSRAKENELDTALENLQQSVQGYNTYLEIQLAEKLNSLDPSRREDPKIKVNLSRFQEFGNEMAKLLSEFNRATDLKQKRKLLDQYRTNFLKRRVRYEGIMSV